MSSYDKNTYLLSADIFADQSSFTLDLVSPPPAPAPLPDPPDPPTPPLPIMTRDDLVPLEPSALPFNILSESDSHWFWQILLLLASWLHLHYHISHAACNLLLWVAHIIFITLGALSLHDRPPLTLNTTLKQLGLVDKFRILPRTTYPVDSIWPLKCRVCSTDIFRPIGFDNPGNPTAYKPVLLTPTMLISEQLQGLFNQPGIEEALDAWQTKGTDPDKIQSMADGRKFEELMVIYSLRMDQNGLTQVSYE